VYRLGLGLAAAAVLLAVLIGWSWAPLATITPEPEAEREPWAIAVDNEVEIISMDAADLLALVVGRPPHDGLLELASRDDVLIDDTGHDVDVHIANTIHLGQPVSPMIIMPRIVAGKD
jgi:hypothetical protein